MKKAVCLCAALIAAIALAKPTGKAKPAEPVVVPDLAAYRAFWAAERPRLAAEAVSNRTTQTTVTICDAAGKPCANASVRLRLKRHAFNFGCNCLVLGQLGEKNAAYERAFTNLFNLATTTFCRGVIEKKEGTFLFEDTGTCEWRRPPPDRSLGFCQANGLRAKGQPLLAGSWHPAWARTRSPDEVRAMYADYFARVARRYGNDYAMFDVVNEAIQHKSFPLYTEELEYVDWAFETAQRLFPKSCALCINEASGANVADDTIDRYYNVVKRIRDKGTRLDGVGIQFHFFREQPFANMLAGKRFTPRKLRSTYDRMWTLGVPLYITEITIPSTLGGLELGEQLQAEVAENLYRFWFAHPGIRGITWWNLCDGAAWGKEGGVRGGLVDADMREKPAYRVLRDLIHREWTTDVTVTTDAEGRASFRGYFGDYEATCARDGRRLASFSVMQNSAPVPVRQAGNEDVAAPWRAYWAVRRAACEAAIEKHRKSDVSVVLRDDSGQVLANRSCEIRQVASDFIWGCNGLCLGQLGPTNAAYEAKLSEFFNLVTTSFCPGVMEPKKGVYRFDADSKEIWRRPPSDRVLAFARAHGQKMKGQPLVCDRWHPAWAKNQTKAEAEEHYREWFRRVAERYGKSVWYFDVVNEAFDAKSRTPDFPLYRRDESLAFVDWSFAEAAKVFPKDCTLGINMGIAATDWNAAGKRYYELCKRIIDQNIRLDAIGFQFHLFGTRDGRALVQLRRWHPDMLHHQYAEFGKLGRPLYITEITIPSTILPGSAGRELQAEMAEDLYRFWFSCPEIHGVTWWNLCDGAAWGVEDRVKGALLDERMGEKPVYARLRKLITQDWRTRVTAKTDADGRVAFRGFRGDYEADFGTGRIVRFVVK